MRFIPVIDEPTASALSRAIYRLGRPASTIPIGEDDSAFTYTEWFVHPVTGLVRMQFIDTDVPQAKMTIDPAADENSLAPFLQLFVNNGTIPASVLTSVRDGIIASKGIWTHIYNFLPDFWKNQSLTSQEMLDGGWFG